MAKLGDVISLQSANVLRDKSYIRGSIHLVGIPYRYKNPISIFHCCENCTENISEIDRISCNNCNNNDFDKCSGYVDQYNANNEDLLKIYTLNSESIPVNTVLKVKARPFLILSNNLDFDYIYGAPIYSLKEKQIENVEFMSLLKNGDIPTQFYLDEKFQGISKPSYIDLLNMVPIHKNLIIKFKGYLSPEDMISISEKVSFLLDIKQFEKVDKLDYLISKRKKIEKELEEINSYISSIKT